METKIKWNEGDGHITATYDGSGSGPASISSDVNEGIDREQNIVVQTTDGEPMREEVVAVKQIGLREVFLPSDGDFILADGGTFNVLKTNEMGGGNFEPIDYVSFDGSTAFDTNMLISSNMTLEIKFAKTGTLSAAKYLYGVLTSPHTATVSAYLGPSGAWRFGTAYTAFTTSDGADHIAETKNTSSRARVTLDGTAREFAKATFTTPRSLLIGGYTNASGSRVKNFVGKIYYFRILNGTELLLDWVPMVRKSDGVEGFYDNVSKSFIERI